MSVEAANFTETDWTLALHAADLAELLALADLTEDVTASEALARENLRTVLGSLTADWPCPSCGAAPRVSHGRLCAVARCALDGTARLEHTGHICGEDIWLGEWPGISECRALGWHAYHDEVTKRWVRCSWHHPEARCDLQRLRSEGEWNQRLRRFEGERDNRCAWNPDA